MALALKRRPVTQLVVQAPAILEVHFLLGHEVQTHWDEG